MSKKKIVKTTDWLTKGMSKEQLEREKREAIMSADLQLCIVYDEWSAREYGTKDVDFDTTAAKMVAMGYRKKSEWISVDERLPLYGELVLVSSMNLLTKKHEWFYLARYSNHTNKGVIFDEKCWLAEDGMIFGHITHWMPLPEPPKKGDAE